MNRLSLFGIVAASLCFLYSAAALYEVRTDWTSVAIGFGFAGVFLCFSLAFAYLRELELKFDHLTRILAETFRKLSAIEQQNHDKSNYGPALTHVSFTFSGKDPLDSMSLEQLEAERKKAEKAEDYEKAARIQRRIDQKRNH